MVPDANYPGSRCKKARFTYSDQSWAGFVELSIASSAGPNATNTERFRQSLTAVPGVASVALHPSGDKTAQGNPSDGHYQQHNFKVYSAKEPEHGIEFELTRNKHMVKGPFTVTACFKMPPISLVPEAWRILRAACEGHELLPGLVERVERKALQQIVLVPRQLIPL